MHEQLALLTTQGHTSIERALERLRQLGLIHLQQNEISRLATNIWIVSRYWIDYCQTRSEQRQITEQEVQEGIQQVRTLLLPYLTPEGRQMAAQAKA